MSCLVVALSLRTSILVAHVPDLHYHIVVTHDPLGQLDGHGDTGHHQGSCHHAIVSHWYY